MKEYLYQCGVNIELVVMDMILSFKVAEKKQ